MDTLAIVPASFPESRVRGVGGARVLVAGKGSSPCRLKQLYRIAVRVFHLNLFAARTGFHLIFWDRP